MKVLNREIKETYTWEFEPGPRSIWLVGWSHQPIFGIDPELVRQRERDEWSMEALSG